MKLNLTQKVLLILVGLIILFDIYLVFTGGVTATISYVIWTASKKFTMIPWSAGILTSHFFAPAPFNKLIPRIRYYIWIGLSIVVLIISLLTMPISPLHPFIVLLIGQAVGIFWSQSKIKGK